MNEVKKASNKLLIAGGIIEIVLTPICMFFGVLATASYFFWAGWLTRTLEFQVQGALGIAGLAAFAFGLAGSISAFKRVYFPLAIFGDAVVILWAALFCALSMLTPISEARLPGVIFGMLIIIVSIVSLVFIALSREAFRKEGVKP